MPTCSAARRPTRPGSGNFGGIKNPAVDALVARHHRRPKTATNSWPACRALDRVIAHEPLPDSGLDRQATRVAYSAWRLERPAAVPPYPPEGVSYMDWPMTVWWAACRPSTCEIAEPHDRLHPQAPAADDADAVRRAAADLHRDPVRAGRAGGAVHRRSPARTPAAPATSAPTAAGRASTRSGSSRSRRCTASTSRRTSASGRCWASSPASTWASSFFQNKDVWQLIKEKLPVSISLGLWTFFISYLIAVPLGVAKAVRAGLALRPRHHAARAGRLRDSRLRAGRGPAGDLRRAAAVVSAARPDVVQLGRAELGRAHRRLPVAHRAAGHGHGAGQLRRDHHADQELVPGGNPQAVRADGARQGPERAPGAVEARVPQCADSHHHRLSGGLHRRVLHRLAADRNAVLARRPGPARATRA